jgi:hypothetical protein
MKQVILLLVFTAALSSTAMATNDDDIKNGDPEKPAKETQYKFSLSTSCFNLFNLFSIEPERTDTLFHEEIELSRLEQPPM